MRRRLHEDQPLSLLPSDCTHMLRCLLERGATETEVVATVENGERFSAKLGKNRLPATIAGLWRGHQE